MPDDVMNHDGRYHQLREAGWRRKLTEAEEAELLALLAAHPAARADWHADAALNDGLDLLPDAAVSSNFTARVLQAAEREKAARARRARWTFWWPSLSWVPRVATAVFVVGFSLLAYHHHQIASRIELAESLVAVADVKSLPAHPEVLKDFEAIRRLSQTPPADEALLALLR